MFDSLIVQFVVLWAVIDPIGSVPVYLSKTIGLPLEDRRKIALKAVLISAGILLFFLVAGQVLLEAMQAGLPIVASASEGAQHLATQIGTPLVGIDDATALALALRTACATPPARVEYPMARFRIEAKLPQIDAFYRMGLARRG